ncbi:metal-dependent hydrolase [Plantactinospora sp. S1510]|uniref:Metal-dependent hydrolase n=1 Tax=Plantactinospora alkalitolerans TaxID=2789879 RepID=A0ABS0H9Q5_9ACTN|nr:metal-dependent hydrolase [Plantactinospora alkalitolerans]MBF9135214.1 metal-dependent hydrolase [Plantactinospora alkalitolerans]
MMAKGHAVSGAASWLVGCAASSWAAGRGLPVPDPTWTHVLAGGVVATGFALFPDIDHKDSTVSTSLGPVSRVTSWVFAHLARAARKASCDHCLRLPKVGGHRALSHTLLFAIAIGVGLSVLAAIYDQTIGVVVFAVAAFLTSYPAFSGKIRAEVGDMLLPGHMRKLSLAAITGHDGRSKKTIGYRLAAFTGSVLITAIPTAILAANTRHVGSWWWIGFAAGWGTLMHILGDLITKSAVPLLWPWKIGPCRWRSVGPPRWMRITTGGRAEKVVVWLMMIAGVAAGGQMVGMLQVLAALWDDTASPDR